MLIELKITGESPQEIKQAVKDLASSYGETGPALSQSSEITPEQAEAKLTGSKSKAVKAPKQKEVEASTPAASGAEEEAPTNDTEKAEETTTSVAFTKDEINAIGQAASKSSDEVDANGKKVSHNKTRAIVMKFAKSLADIEAPNYPAFITALVGEFTAETIADSLAKNLASQIDEKQRENLIERIKQVA